MATTPARSGSQAITIPRPATSSQPPQPSSQSTQTTQSTIAQQKQSHFDLSISLLLHTWPALSVAVSNNWGGPDSPAKRDWFAGATSDLFLSNPSTDQEDLECMLLQVMEDEFDVRLEDESEVEVAGEICRFRRLCERGDFREVQALQGRWESRRGEPGLGAGKVVIEHGGRGELDEAEGSSEEESGTESEDGGVEVDAEAMDVDEAPRLVERRSPEVDEEGFTKVVGRKKR